MSTVALTISEIHNLAKQCLLNNGCNEETAQAVAKNMSAAEQDGSESHGLFRLPAHIASLRSGKANGQAKPKLEELTPAALRLDADNGFAPLAHDIGIPRLVEATNSLGIAMLAIRKSFHIAALWPEVEAIAEHNLVGLACTVHTPMVAPFGAKKAFFSTNPIAFAYPRPNKDPYVFDMATAAKARGDVGVAARDGHELPLGIGLDADGNPTTDAKKIHEGGVILPFGGYKGSALATMIELLSAGLIGDYFSYEAVETDDYDGGFISSGEFIMALSPKLLAGEGWDEHSESFFSRLESLEGVRLPGKRRFENRASDAARQINAELVEQIKSLTEV